MTENILEIHEVTKRFGHGIFAKTVLDRVSLRIPRGTAVGLVGESGSGKSTIGKIACGVYGFDGGSVQLAGQTFEKGDPYKKAARGTIAYIPQNPFSSFDPRRTVGQSLVEALDPRAPRPGSRRAELVRWLDRVALPADSLERYPHEFSGGQRQRLAVARGLLRDPELVVADEITSALDVSVQAQVLQLLDELRAERDFSLLFISHNLAVIQNVCDEVLVMKGGAIVESGPTDRILSTPENPYTRHLLNSIPGSPGFSLDSA
ncbi:ABC transporter ATP-binding protein [Brevibacterium moorei]|uniref:ABC transporter ATP-binding protein n=1 Tax=Brevibacterium moorei TaxID=2968457 RepID=UPI00211CEF9C|nr:ABC transporter ATP-binding protein [Brevibacterium sp. 68QC2CO]MCQ9386935.1 ATP-binding cassette domain-containing protein [Brevibacterium sp. 68QC2CO]